MQPRHRGQGNGRLEGWASTQRLVLAQEAAGAKDNECAAILGRLDLKGALVTIDAIATNPTVAGAIYAEKIDGTTAPARTGDPQIHNLVL